MNSSIMPLKHFQNQCISRKRFNCAYEITRTETRKISVKHKKLHKSYSNFYIHDNGHFLKIGVITRKVFFLMFT